MQRSIVDLPDPEGPAITIAFPRGTSRSMSSRTRRSPKLLRTRCSETSAPFSLETPDDSTIRASLPPSGSPGRSRRALARVRSRARPGGCLLGGRGLRRGGGRRRGVLELLLGAEQRIEHGLAEVLAQRQRQHRARDRDQQQPAPVALLLLAAQPVGGVAQVLGGLLQ